MIKVSYCPAGQLSELSVIECHMILCTTFVLRFTRLLLRKQKKDNLSEFLN